MEVRARPHLQRWTSPANREINATLSDNTPLRHLGLLPVRSTDLAILFAGCLPIGVVTATDPKPTSSRAPVPRARNTKKSPQGVSSSRSPRRISAILAPARYFQRDEASTQTREGNVSVTVFRRLLLVAFCGWPPVTQDDGGRVEGGFPSHCPATSFDTGRVEAAGHEPGPRLRFSFRRSKRQTEEGSPTDEPSGQHKPAPSTWSALAQCSSFSESRPVEQLAEAWIVVRVGWPRFPANRPERQLL